MRELHRKCGVSMPSLVEIRRWLRRESERLAEAGLRGGYAHPRPPTPAHVLNWVVCWLSQQTEGDRDRVIREGRRVMDHLAGLDEPPREIPSVPLDVDPPVVGPLERVGRPKLATQGDDPRPKKARRPKRR